MSAPVSTSYMISADSLVVHREDCPLINRPRTEYWNSPWEPGGETSSKYDRPCRRCLPDGIPGVLSAVPREAPRAPRKVPAVAARTALRDIVIDTLSRAGADMAQVGIDQIVTEAVDRLAAVRRE